MLQKIVKAFKANTTSTRAMWFTVGLLMVRGIGLFTAPVFTRLLTPEQYGVFSLFSIWATMFSMVCGLYTYGAYPAARARFEGAEWRAFLSNTLALSSLGFAVFALPALVFRDGVAAVLQVPASFLPLLLLYAFAIFVVNAHLTVLAQEKKQIAYFLLSSLLMCVCIGLAILLALRLPDRLLGRVYGLALPYIGLAAVLYVRTMRQGRSLFMARHWRFALAVSLPLIFQAVFSLLIPQSNRLMLSAYGDGDSAGIYSMAFTFGAILEDIALSFNLSWIPTYFEHLNAGRYEQAQNQGRGYADTVTLLTLGFLLTSPEIYRLLVAPAYWAGLPLLALITGSVYLRFWCFFPMNYAIYQKKTGWTLPASLLAFAVNIGSNALLIPRLGGVGAAISTVAAYAAMLIALWGCAGFGFPLPHKTGGMAWGMSAVTACAALSLVTPWQWWARWPLAVVCAALLLGKVIRKRGFF